MHRVRPAQRNRASTLRIRPPPPDLTSHGGRIVLGEAGHRSILLWLVARDKFVCRAGHGSIIAFRRASPSLTSRAAMEMPSEPGAAFLREAQPARVLIPLPDNPERGHSMPFTLLPDDELIARLLIHTWTLNTGKTLRCDVPPHELTEEELIDFWSDDRFD